MSWANIRQALKLRLQGVAGTGTVHAFQRVCRLTSANKQYQALFCTANRVNTWMVTRTKRTSSNVSGETKSRIRHRVLLMGLYEQQDELLSDQTFEDIVEAVCEDLRTGDRTLGGACLTFGDVEADVTLGNLVDVHCHFAQLAFDVEEIVS